MSSGYDHSIQRYKESQKRLEQASDRLEELIAAVREAEAVLGHPGQSCVSDRSGVMGEQRIVQAAYMLEASRWPRIQDIDAALKEYQKAETAHRGSYQALSFEDRQFVAPER